MGTLALAQVSLLSQSVSMGTRPSLAVSQAVSQYGKETSCSKYPSLISNGSDLFLLLLTHTTRREVSSSPPI